ncbi:MAG: bifunctional diaminohydroxyphosphoribosylaminopyrimidine deaminase/5-amino-6-(5-phosphoribosylamino)uracil reductase RibD, partial [Eubacterium sp.]|nr:bifunctional diaminohydroxyphosphoribosylaminopyrimidine deaminase/5-amino-6-(5-phosphoribosylamino)uracil reductase RibD [Eubacterium sp.]
MINSKKTDEKYMRRCIELARRGEGIVNPNPMVGCVVVKDDKIISEAWHKRFGEFHAERQALQSLDDASGATLYVNLEPCCHTGKTPPCTDIIIEKNVKRVVVGSDDPNPLVAGKGIQALLDAGIEVTTGVLKKECDVLNEVFMCYISSGMPFLAIKYAMTIDGKIATAGGESKWITGVEARSNAQRLRKKYMAILAGIGTVAADNPMFNFRPPETDDPYVAETDKDKRCQPIRVILDSHLNISPNAQIIKTAREYRTIIACTGVDIPDMDAKIKNLEISSAEVWKIPADDKGRVGIIPLLKKLGASGIDSVLVEGGAGVHGSFLEAYSKHRDEMDVEGPISRVYAYVAPKMVGGSTALAPVGGYGVP